MILHRPEKKSFGSLDMGPYEVSEVLTVRCVFMARSSYLRPRIVTSRQLRRDYLPYWSYQPPPPSLDISAETYEVIR
jgi:hypothetical protein